MAENRELVESLKSRGVPNEQIAKIVGVTVDQLYEDHEEALNNALSYANFTIADVLFKMATGTLSCESKPHFGAINLWLKYFYTPPRPESEKSDVSAKNILVVPAETSLDQWLTVDENEGTE